MPNYQGSGNTGPLLYENRQGIFWYNEAPAAGVASVGFQLGHSKGNGRQGMISINIFFAANPGAYQVNVELADFDTATAWVPAAQLGPGSSTLNANFTTRQTLNSVGSDFIRLAMVANPNNVAMIALVSRA